MVDAIQSSGRLVSVGEGDVAVQVGLAGEVNDGHAAPADLAEDLEATDALALPRHQRPPPGGGRGARSRAPPVTPEPSSARA